MSGGSYNYAYRHVEEMAEQLCHSQSPIRRAFAAHLLKVSQAMHDIEWVDSCDKGPGDEVEAIKACFTDSFPQLTREALDSMFNDFHQRLCADYKTITGNEWKGAQPTERAEKGAKQ